MLCLATICACSGGSDANPDAAGSADSPPADRTPREVRPGCFQPAAEPQLRYGDLFPGATWNDPSVLRTDTGYVMYASASATFTPIFVQIYRLVSTDAIHWALSPSTPVLSPAGTSKGVETPSVVQFAGRYHLFYTTYPGELIPSTFTIGHAVSDDGIAWTVLDRALIRPTGKATDWNGQIVGEPGAVVVADQLLVYFTALGTDAGLGNTSQVIGVVTSSDGTRFSPPAQVLAPDRARLPRSAGWVGFSTPSAVVIDGVVHLFTDVASDAPDARYDDGWLQVGLHHASSRTGVADWTQDADFLQQRGTPAWTARELRSVTPLLDGDTLRLWWAGDDLYRVIDGERQYDVTRWGIGASTCLLGT